MLDHHIQKKIVATLVKRDTARFSEIRPGGIDSNIFAYHLKTLMREKLVQKLPNNTYSLTAAGTFASVHLSHDPIEVLELAHSIIFVAVHRHYAMWLLQKQPKQPFRRKFGFLSVEPSANASTLDTVRERFGSIVGQAQVRVAGSGYIRVRSGASLESFRHFTLVDINVETLADIPISSTQKWCKLKDIIAEECVLGVCNLTQELKNNHKQYFFTELEFTL